VAGQNRIGRRNEDVLVPVHARDAGDVGPTEPPGARDDGVEHPGAIGRRGRDDAQDFAGGGLLLVGLGEGAVPVGKRGLRCRVPLLKLA